MNVYELLRTNSWNSIKKSISLVTLSFIKGLMSFHTFEIGSGIIQFFKCYFKLQRQDTIFVLFLHKLMV